MRTSSEQQATGVKSQLMTEIVLNVLSLRIFGVKMLITFRHRMNLRYVRYDIDVIANALIMINRQQSLLWNLRPFGGNAVQIAALRKELTFDGIRRDNDFCLLVDFQEMLKSSCMIAMTVRDKHIVNPT